MFTRLDKAIVAAIMAVVMMLQYAGVGMPEWLTEDWARGLAAVLTPILVYLWPNRDPDPFRDRRLSSPPWVGLVSLLVVASMLASCAGTRAAYKAADGLNETAKVVGEHYYALVRELNALDDAGALSPGLRADAQEIVRDAQPLVAELAAAGRAYEAVRSAETELELEAAIAEAARVISRLIDAMKRAGGSAALDPAPAAPAGTVALVW